MQQQQVGHDIRESGKAGSLRDVADAVQIDEVRSVLNDCFNFVVALSTPRNSMPAKTRGLRLMLLTELGG
ncbi:hypothetical protein, partial [Xanthomonas arboricola]